jgi:hypothetical protein
VSPLCTLALTQLLARLATAASWATPSCTGLCKRKKKPLHSRENLEACVNHDGLKINRGTIII